MAAKCLSAAKILQFTVVPLSSPGSEQEPVVAFVLQCLLVDLRSPVCRNSLATRATGIEQSGLSHNAVFRSGGRTYDATFLNYSFTTVAQPRTATQSLPSIPL